MPVPSFPTQEQDDFVKDAYKEAADVGAGELAADFTDFYAKRQSSFHDSLGDGAPLKDHYSSAGALLNDVQKIVDYNAAVAAQATATANKDAADAAVAAAAAAITG